ncbi:hypothetical protein CI238_11981 [Colletotrichum incanum]|uniref:Uncharacterized protein n=1 Tax=Colletotrichum incanum TaxID=1573173 RepID=A0A166LAA8_COLIC|nr:hypothetical protein CI238_11981 [Colletotrichum incanum]
MTLTRFQSMKMFSDAKKISYSGLFGMPELRWLSKVSEADFRPTRAEASEMFLDAFKIDANVLSETTDGRQSNCPRAYGDKPAAETSGQPDITLAPATLDSFPTGPLQDTEPTILHTYTRHDLAATPEAFETRSLDFGYSWTEHSEWTFSLDGLGPQYGSSADFDQRTDLVDGEMLGTSLVDAEADQEEILAFLGCWEWNSDSSESSDTSWPYYN